MNKSCARDCFLIGISFFALAPIFKFHFTWEMIQCCSGGHFLIDSSLTNDIVLLWSSFSTWILIEHRLKFALEFLVLLNSRGQMIKCCSGAHSLFVSKWQIETFLVCSFGAHFRPPATWPTDRRLSPGLTQFRYTLFVQRRALLMVQVRRSRLSQDDYYSEVGITREGWWSS